MSLVYTFDNIKNNILPSYLERNDPAMLNHIPVWIDFAQRRISRDFKSLGFVTYLTTTFAAGLPVYQKPNGWGNTLNINIGTGPGFDVMKNLELRAYTFITECHPNRTERGEPQYFADYGYDNWLIAPTPDEDYPAEISTLGLPIAIDESHQTNWVTRFAPDLLIKACLIEAMIYLKNDERREVLEKEYMSILQGLKLESSSRMTDQYAVQGKAYNDKLQ